MTAALAWSDAVDRGAIVRGRSARHRRRSGSLARRPGSGALARDAARGVADLRSR